MTIWSPFRGNKDLWTPGGSEKNQNPSPHQKVTRSPTKVPLAHGIKEQVSGPAAIFIRVFAKGSFLGQEWEDSGRTLTYKFRRTFRAALAYTGYQSGGWDAESWQYTDSKDGGGAKTTVSDVFCAVNLFNQPHVYRYSKFNGFCYNPGNNPNSVIGQFIYFTLSRNRISAHYYQDMDHGLAILDVRSAFVIAHSIPSLLILRTIQIR